MLNTVTRRVAGALSQGSSRALTTASSPTWQLPATETLRESFAEQDQLDALVCKFGGSSVGNADAVKRVASLLSSYREAGAPVVGVLSAFYGVTDRLLEVSAAAQAGDEAGMKAAYNKLLHWHEGVAYDLFADVPSELTAQHNHLHETLSWSVWRTAQEMAEAGSATAKQADQLVTAGERISNHVMSGMLRKMGTASEYVPADELIVTDGEYGNASPNLRASRGQVQARLYPLLGNGAVPCVTGFFGSHPAGGSVCTFGRGGSDLTSSTLANCLSSQPGRAAVIVWKVECEKGDDGTMKGWQDGFTGVVHDAAVDVTIPRLSYREAAQLVAFGKKVLHSETMAPAEARSIPVIVKNTLRPELPGTRICADGRTGGKTTDAHPGSAPAAGSDAELPVTSITKATLSSAMEKVSDMGLDEAALSRSLGGVTTADTSLLVLVGEDVAQCSGTRHDALKALAENSIPTYVPSRVNDSPHSLCIAVPSENIKEALHALHAGVVGQAAAEAQATARA